MCFLFTTTVWVILFAEGVSWDPPDKKPLCLVCLKLGHTVLVELPPHSVRALNPGFTPLIQVLIPNSVPSVASKRGRGGRLHPRGARLTGLEEQRITGCDLIPSLGSNLV